MPTLKILVAEDDLLHRHRLGHELAKHGYDVICVVDGYQALDYAVRERPDVLVLNVHMPAGGGFGVRERMQQHPEIAPTPIIYMTHDPSTEIETAAATHGGFSLLHKPFNVNDLVATIESALRCRSAA